MFPVANYMSSLAGYPAHLCTSVQQMIENQGLAGWLLKKYPRVHPVRTDRALYDYVDTLKNEYLRNVGPLSRVHYDGKLQSVRQALGTHTRVARVQGSRLKTKREIRIAALFREVPAEFLRMIVVHELAHMKVLEHDKAFYQLCSHMAPDYAQLEFELRAYLCYLAAGGEVVWNESSPVGALV